MNQLNKNNLARAMGLSISIMTILILLFIIWYSSELVLGGFPLENIVNGKFPLEYNVGQGSIFNTVQFALELGFFFVIGLGIFCASYFRKNA